MCRIIFIVGKIAIVIVMMIIAAFMYRSKYNKWTLVPFLFGIYIICVSNGLLVTVILTNNLLTRFSF